MNSAIIVRQRNNGQNIHFAMYLGFGYLSDAVRSKRHILQFTEDFHCFTRKKAENTIYWQMFMTIFMAINLHLIFDYIRRYLLRKPSVSVPRHG